MLTIKQIETALRATGGFVSQTAKKLNVTQEAIYFRINKSDYLKQVKHEIDESYLDLAESKLMKKMNEEDLGALCFFLKCKGKGRGYIEKVIEKPIEQIAQQPQTIRIVMEDARRLEASNNINQS